jgi:hypothetical protein
MTEDKKDDFDLAFEELVVAESKTPEQQEADRKAAEAATAAAAAAAETPEAKAAREATEAAAAETARVAAEAATAAAAAAAETPEAKATREAAEKVAADAAAKAVADAKVVSDATAAAQAEAARKAAETAAAAETPEAKAAREAIEASIKPYEPDDTEKAALAQFQKEFPGEYKGMMARFKEQDRTINARVYEAVQKILKEHGGRLANVEATVTTSAVDRHFADLHAAHADYDAVIPKVDAWINTQPAYLQPAMRAVYEGGTTADVSALVADYKKANGIAAVAAAPAAAAPAAKAAAAGADDLAPVTTRRTTTAAKGAPDKNDYSGAWEELGAA